MNIETPIVLDCETYPNYFLVSLRRVGGDKIINLECRGEDGTLSEKDIKLLLSILIRETTFGFNSINFDMPLILLAVQKVTAIEINNLCEAIINGCYKGYPAWMILQEEGLQMPPSVNHFDVSNVAPGVGVSLKLYGARMMTPLLQTLPITPGTTLTDSEMNKIRDYCGNDLQLTIDLFNEIKPAMHLRHFMGKTLGVEIQSKSDAQIAECIIRKEISSANSDKKTIPKHVSYQGFDNIKFSSPSLTSLLSDIYSCKFPTTPSGSIVIPSLLKDRKIRLGKTDYQIGIGGLHSKQKALTIIPKENEKLIECDVSSYYPSLILNLELFPESLGRDFLGLYERIYSERLDAKSQGDTDKSNSLKIVINGTFGKLGNRYSCMYSPNLLLTITLTGQLLLLMMIEKLELAGISVVSANTDSVTAIIPNHLHAEYDKICSQWQSTHNLVLDKTLYKSIFFIAVNDYFAIKEDGGIHTKSSFSEGGINKNPNAYICSRAVIDFVKEGKDIEKNIRSSLYLNEFLIVRKVNGGALFRDCEIGNVARWIKSSTGECIKRSSNWNKVSNSDDAFLIPRMDIDFPEKEIDYDWYINQSYKILLNLGYTDL